MFCSLSVQVIFKHSTTFVVLLRLLFSVHSQLISGNFPNSRERPYPGDYYERYPQYDRHPVWNSPPGSPKFIKTGLESVYSDRRCVEGNKDFKGPVSIKTRLGNVEGTYVYLCDGPGVSEFDRPKPDSKDKRIQTIYRNVTIFLGIPYAKPPTKENGLRFKPPQFLPSFNVLRALQYKDACPQAPAYYGVNKGVPETNEDCLYLNIFSPSISERSQEKYPVMIYIHGGDWDHGNANVFPAQMLAASQEVVVVTFNYRLGPLGFFATADNASSGNYGLLDQAMAIEWVYDNIDAFHGDPKLITLFGPGVGAASAGIHMLSSRLNNKIRRVIAQSGAAVADWASIVDPTIIYNNSVEFAKQLNCHYSSAWRTVDCLRDQSIAVLQVTALKPKVGWLPWGPVIDAFTRNRSQQVLSASPEMLLKDEYTDFPDGFAYMAGVTKDEALSMVLEDSNLKNNQFKVTKDFFLKKIQRFPAIYNYTLDAEALTKAISFFYLPCDEKSENITLLKQAYIDMLSDSYFKAPNDKMIKMLLAKGVKTYMYVLNSTLEGIKKVRDPDLDLVNNSVPHDAEYYFITGAPFMDPYLYPNDHKIQDVKWTEADRNMSQFFMTSWANFAKFGNPTPSVLFDSILWTESKLHDLRYLSVNTTNYTTVMMSNYRQKESQFWNVYLPDLMQLVLPTWPPTYQPWELQKNIYEASLWGVVGAVLLFSILSLLCCCLYCRAKSKHIVSTEDIPDAVSTAPSSIDTLLNMKKTEPRSRYLAQRAEMEQKHTQV